MLHALAIIAEHAVEHGGDPGVAKLVLLDGPYLEASDGIVAGKGFEPFAIVQHDPGTGTDPGVSIAVPEKTINTLFADERIFELVDLFVVKAAKAFGCADPDILRIVLENREYAVVVEPVAGAVIGKMQTVEAADPSAVGGKPHVPVVILQQVDDLGLRQPVLDGIILKIEQLGIRGYANAKKKKRYVGSFKGHKCSARVKHL
jgi:hypothetical protein